MLKKVFATLSLVTTICLFNNSQVTVAEENSDTLESVDTTDVLTDYDILNAPATPVGEEPPYLSNNMTTGVEDPTSLGSTSHNQSSNGNDDGVCIIEGEEELQQGNATNTPASTTNDVTTDQNNPLGHCKSFIIKTSPRKWSVNDTTNLGNSNGQQLPKNNNATSTTPVQTPTQQVTPDNITPQPAQTPTIPHTNSKVLPNTGGDTQTSTLAIFSILLLGGFLLAYRPVTALFKTK